MHPQLAGRRWSGALLLVGIVLAGCGDGAASLRSTSSSVAQVPPSTPATSPGTSSAPPSSTAIPSQAPATEAPPSQAPDTGGGTTSGDIPDNAVFLTYKNSAHAFSIQYVEGWQVMTGPDGVVVRDKDSSETVVVVALPSDLGSYITGTDLPSLQSQAGYTFVKQDTVKVGTNRYDHVVVHLPAPPDPVTGKRVPSTVDRFYVPGATGLAIISLSTPDGVDNVDAFRQMIESFRWS